MGRRAGKSCVVLDTSTLLNFLMLDRIDLLATLPGLDFFVSATVEAEVVKEDGPAKLRAAFGQGLLRRIDEDATEELALYTDYRDRAGMGAGEASCLAIAATRGWMLASDDHGPFRREAKDVIGEGRLLTTPEIFVLAIRARVLSIEEADELKGELSRMRFAMAFASFRELVDDEQQEQQDVRSTDRSNSNAAQASTKGDPR